MYKKSDNLEMIEYSNFDFVGYVDTRLIKDFDFDFDFDFVGYWLCISFNWRRNTVEKGKTT